MLAALETSAIGSVLDPKLDVRISWPGLRSRCFALDNFNNVVTAAIGGIVFVLKCQIGTRLFQLVGRKAADLPRLGQHPHSHSCKHPCYCHNTVMACCPDPQTVPDCGGLPDWRARKPAKGSRKPVKTTELDCFSELTSLG